MIPISQMLAVSERAMPRAARTRMRQCGSLPTILLLLLLTACSDRIVPPEPPATATLEVTISLAGPDEGGLREVLARADRVRLRLEREAGPDETREVESALERVTLNVSMLRDRETAQLIVEASRAGAALFRGSGEVELRAGESLEVALSLLPVLARVAARAPAPLESLGETVQLSGAVLFASGDTVPGPSVSWRALDEGIVELAPDGSLTALAEGAARVEARHDALADTMLVEVRAVVAAVDVEVSAATLLVGETLRLRAVLRDARGNALATHDPQDVPIAGRAVAWITSRPLVAGVEEETGVVTALAPDTVTISAITIEERSGSIQLTITPLAPVVSDCVSSAITATGATLSCAVHPNQAETEVDFEWAVSGGTVQRSASRSAGSGAAPVEVVETIAGLLPRTTYYWRVEATSAGGVTRSPVRSFTTLDVPPAAPNGLQALASAFDQVDLSWQDGSDNETGFRISRRDVTAGEEFALLATVGANTTSYHDRAVHPETGYEYRVKAFNAVGVSAYSEPAGVTTPAAPNSPLHTVVDDFRGTLLDLGRWSFYADSAKARQNDGLLVTLTPNVAGYGGVITRRPHLLPGSLFSAEVGQVAVGGPLTETFVGVASLDEQEYVVITSLASRLGAWRKWRGQSPTRVGPELLFSAAAHRFRRIREEEGVIHFELSADGVTWVRPEGWSIANGFTDAGALHGLIGAGAFMPDPAAGTAIFAGVNVAHEAEARPAALPAPRAAIVPASEPARTAGGRFSGGSRGASR